MNHYLPERKIRVRIFYLSSIHPFFKRNRIKGLELIRNRIINKLVWQLNNSSFLNLLLIMNLRLVNDHNYFQSHDWFYLFL